MSDDSDSAFLKDKLKQYGLECLLQIFEGKLPTRTWLPTIFIMAECRMCENNYEGEA